MPTSRSTRTSREPVVLVVLDGWGFRPGRDGNAIELGKHRLPAVELGRRAELRIAIHAWLDGRDTPPKSGLGFMEELLEDVGVRSQESGTSSPAPGSRLPAPVVSTVTGRYFAMDRDKRWDRNRLVYDAHV